MIADLHKFSQGELWELHELLVAHLAQDEL